MVKYFKLSENKNLEIQIDKFRDDLSTSTGWFVTLSTWGLWLKLGLILLQAEIAIRWRGDHTGAEFNMNFFDGTFFCINFYDSRHEEDWKV